MLAPKQNTQRAQKRCTTKPKSSKRKYFQHIQVPILSVYVRKYTVCSVHELAVAHDVPKLLHNSLLLVPLGMPNSEV